MLCIIQQCGVFDHDRLKGHEGGQGNEGVGPVVFGEMVSGSFPRLDGVGHLTPDMRDDLLTSLQDPSPLRSLEAGGVLHWHKEAANMVALKVSNPLSYPPLLSRSCQIFVITASSWLVVPMVCVHFIRRRVMGIACYMPYLWGAWASMTDNSSYGDHWPISSPKVAT